MMMMTVLSFSPLAGVTSHTHGHQGEFSRTVFSSAGGEKVLVFIPRPGMRGMDLATVYSWITAGYTIVQCLPAPSPGDGLHTLANHCDTAVDEYVRKLETDPAEFVLLGAGLGANIALLMSLERYSQLVLVDSEP